ncbi:hypothetical protein MMC21_002439 [Puttea exsequens]|nr:hypothetical protein [Puttea exsequens]
MSDHWYNRLIILLYLLSLFKGCADARSHHHALQKRTVPECSPIGMGLNLIAEDCVVAMGYIEPREGQNKHDLYSFGRTPTAEVSFPVMAWSHGKYNQGLAPENQAHSSGLGTCIVSLISNHIERVQMARWLDVVLVASQILSYCVQKLGVGGQQTIGRRKFGILGRSQYDDCGMEAALTHGCCFEKVGKNPYSTTTTGSLPYSKSGSFHPHQGNLTPNLFARSNIAESTK